MQGERIAWIEIQDHAEVPFRALVIVTDHGSDSRKVQTLTIAGGEAT